MKAGWAGLGRILDGRQTEILGLGLVLGLVILAFGISTPRFLTLGTFQSMAFQLPELGLLTLAMLIPILSGGLNLAVTFSANICALVMAWTLQSLGGPEAGMLAFLLGVGLALLTGFVIGTVMGLIVAYLGAHPILVSLSMMIFLRGVGELVTRGGDISGFPRFVTVLGHGTIAAIPVPLIIFVIVVFAVHILLTRTRLGFATHMLGSNIEATRYSGINTKRALTLVYSLSGVIAAIAGVIMLTRFNSVRIGHGEAYLLITVLACFLGGVDPFGGFGRTVSVVLALIILQAISSGLNLMGANQHLATGLWGAFLIAVMVVRWAIGRLRAARASASSSSPRASPDTQTMKEPAR